MNIFSSHTSEKSDKNIVLFYAKIDKSKMKNKKNRKSKKFFEEYEFYIKQNIRRRICYNKECKQCKNDCKQSFRVEIVCCPNKKIIRKRNNGKKR